MAPPRRTPDRRDDGGTARDGGTGAGRKAAKVELHQHCVFGFGIAAALERAVRPRLGGQQCTTSARLLPPEPCAPPAPWFYSIPEWAGVPARAVAQQAPTHTLGHFPHPTTFFSAMCGTRHRVSALSVRVAGREETACAPRLPLESDFPTIATITFPPSGGGAPNAKGGR